MLSRLFGLVRPAKPNAQPTLENSISSGASEKKVQNSAAAREAIETVDSSDFTPQTASMGYSNMARPSGVAAFEASRSRQQVKDDRLVSADLEKSNTSGAISDLVQTTKDSEAVSVPAIIRTPEACDAASNSTPPSTSIDNLGSVTTFQPQSSPGPVTNALDIARLTPTSSFTSTKKRKYNAQTTLVQTPRKQRARKPWQAHSTVFKLDPSISHAWPSSIVSTPFQSRKQPTTALAMAQAPANGFMRNSSSSTPFPGFDTFESSPVRGQQSQQPPTAFSPGSSQVSCFACRSQIPGYHIPGCRQGGRCAMCSCAVHFPHPSWCPGAAVALAQKAHPDTAHGSTQQESTRSQNFDLPMSHIECRNTNGSLNRSPLRGVHLRSLQSDNNSITNNFQKQTIPGMDSYTNEQASSDGLVGNGIVPSAQPEIELDIKNKKNSNNGFAGVGDEGISAKGTTDDSTAAGMPEFSFLDGIDWDAELMSPE